MKGKKFSVPREMSFEINNAMFYDDTGIVGVDEAGRGPLAGPVVAAAVMLNPLNPIEGLRDSKKLSAKKRDALFEDIIHKALAYGVGFASHEEIDQINILQATFLAMRRAVAQLDVIPRLILVDGNQDPNTGYLTKTIIQGDVFVPAISAASILAKVTRDMWMTVLEGHYPCYGFAQHKGYPTRSHQNILSYQGLTELHRKSFCQKFLRG